MTEKMPALFIGHGSPMNIIYENSYTQSLKRMAIDIPRPKAIVVLSAHWVTHGLYVTCDHKPRQIYDFYGFPETLYLEKYNCHGSPEVARQIVDIVKKSKAECSLDWGLDHGSWAVLKHMYPDADIPVLQISYDATRPTDYNVILGKELASLRNEGVLFIGSGNIVHNLRMVDFDNINADVPAWASEFDGLVKDLILQKKIKALTNYLTIGKNGKTAVPTSEHYIPLLFIMGLLGNEENAVFFHEGFQHGTISMRCFRIG